MFYEDCIAAEKTAPQVQPAWGFYLHLREGSEGDHVRTRPRNERNSRSVFRLVMVMRPEAVFFGLPGILTAVIKYLQLLLNLIFKKKYYNFESIEKLTK